MFQNKKFRSTPPTHLGAVSYHRTIPQRIGHKSKNSVLASYNKLGQNLYQSHFSKKFPQSKIFLSVSFPASPPGHLDAQCFSNLFLKVRRKKSQNSDLASSKKPVKTFCQCLISVPLLTWVGIVGCIQQSGCVQQDHDAR